MSLAIWLTLAGCLVASYCDVRSRRIPNVLTGSMALAAVIFYATLGWHALAVSVAVMVVMTLAGALVYSRGGIGAGDIKLAIAGSGLLGYPLCVPFLLYTAISGGALAVTFLLVRGSARASLARAALLTVGAAGTTTDRREKMPYALAFALGAIIVALSESVAPFLRLTI